MRRIVLQMMTTLNGRLDDPMAWVHGVSDKQYREIDRLYETYDTILVGRRTYEEMANYWPGVLATREGSETNARMALRMTDCRKLVFSRSDGPPLSPWQNVERVIARNDDELARRIVDLKTGPGRTIHLSGGAGFAQTVVALGLVDQFHFYVYPVISPGKTWHAGLIGQTEMQLIASRSFENGVLSTSYSPVARAPAQPSTFTDMLTG